MRRTRSSSCLPVRRSSPLRRPALSRRAGAGGAADRWPVRFRGRSGLVVVLLRGAVRRGSTPVRALWRGGPIYAARADDPRSAKPDAGEGAFPGARRAISRCTPRRACADARYGRRSSSPLYPCRRARPTRPPLRISTRQLFVENGTPGRRVTRRWLDETRPARRPCPAPLIGPPGPTAAVADRPEPCPHILKGPGGGRQSGRSAPPRGKTSWRSTGPRWRKALREPPCTVPTTRSAAPITRGPPRARAEFDRRPSTPEPQMADKRCAAAQRFPGPRARQARPA